MDVERADQENLFRIRFRDTIKWTAAYTKRRPLDFHRICFSALPVGNWTTDRIFRQREEQPSHEHKAPLLRYELFFTSLKGVIWKEKDPRQHMNHCHRQNHSNSNLRFSRLSVPQVGWSSSCSQVPLSLNGARSSDGLSDGEV